MQNFIRPEIQVALWQWWEVIVGAGLIAMGLWWSLGVGGLMMFVGVLAAFVGASLIFVGLPRGRFRGTRDGVGSVDFDEGQITYFGPLTGGAVALRDLDELALIRHGQSPHWRLTGGGDALFIPTGAAGADELFDAFATLPGLRTGRLLSALEEAGAHDTVIWTRDSGAFRSDRLH